MLFASLFFYLNFFSQITAVLAFVCGAEAVGGLQRPEGGHVAGEACAAVVAELTRRRECGWRQCRSPTRFCVFGL
jgi:hypothetical protein